MRKKLSLLLSLLLCLGLVPSAYADNSPFTDVAPDFWAYEEIMEAYNAGVMTGTGTTESGGKIFTPSGKLNFPQFVTILTRAFYNDDVQNKSFSGPWPEPNYLAAYLHDLFTDVRSWSYSSEVEVTREVMAQMMYNVMVDKGAILPGAAEIQATMNKIPDLSSVDSNYKTAVAVCYYLDLLSGVDASGTFAPKGVLNRAQTAVIYVRLKKAVNTLSTGIPATPGTASPDTPPQTPSGATLTNGMPVTEENVLALLEEYRNGKEPGERANAAGFTSYVDVSKYDAYEPKYRIVLPSGPMNGIECAKFAFAFFDELFGEDTPMREVTDKADIRPGDLLHFDGHWAIATTNTYSTQWIEFNIRTVDGGEAGIIAWGNVDKSLRNLITAYTRYPE
ncbi:MAG: S-layer homology domain-containing protein [Oscillospiraceae bacterium]|nr:S-layer homology domain-containing protein [Oscillospiraceae bacterium]